MRISFRLTALLLIGLTSCRSQRDEGEVPPEVITARPAAVSVCSAVPRDFDPPDLKGVLSPRVAEFCVDPNSAPRAYGRDGDGDMDEVCTELFNGECELYKALGLQRVTSVRFVSNTGASALVSANVSRFGGPEGALAFYSRRVLGDQDPKNVNLRSVPGVPRAALGTGVAYAQSGPLVVELVYVNDEEPPLAIRATSDRILPEFLKSFANSDAPAPAAVSSLPDAHRLPFGVTMHPKDGFGVGGLGPVATGYYEEGEKRYRISVSESPDEGAAKDVYAGARRLPGLHLLKQAPFEAFEVRQVDAEGTVIWWLFAKQGNRVVAVSDEPWALRGATPEEQGRRSLDRAAKFDVLRRVFRGE